MWPEQIGFIVLELGPTPFPLPPSSAKQRLFQTVTADNRGLLLSPTPSWRAFFLEKAGLQHLSSCPPAAYYWDQVSDEYGPEMGAPFCPAPTREWRLYLKCGVAGDPGAWSPWPTSISIVIWSHEGLRVLPYTVEGHGVSHMEMLGISPTLSFRALRFCLGDKHAIKPMAPDVPSK